MARPTTLTPETAIGIVTLIEHGVHPVVAAGSFGVARSTYYQWIQRGETIDDSIPAEPLFVSFADDVRAAEYKAESTLVGLAITKVKTTADAIQLLERRFSERWQRREEVTINLRREAEKIATETGLDADEIVAEAEAILAGRKR
jgi:hypothetical protein